MFSRFLRSLLSILPACAALAQTPAPTPPAAINTDPGTRPIILPEPANPKLPTLFLIGDSTVRNGRDDGQGKGADGQWGWGNPLAAFFDQTNINVVNRAVGGLSSRTYLTSGHWERALAFVKPGDFVIMQFGHNDEAPINDDKRARGTIKGVGDESQEIDNLLTKKHETVHSYGWYLRKFVADTRAKGATPIICSLIPRKSWDEEGKIVRHKKSYAGWAAEVAAQEKVAFIDLNEEVARQYDELGREAVMKFFPTTVPDEHTHTNWAGAVLNARTVVNALQALPNHQLSSFILAQEPTLTPPAATIKSAEDERPVVDASKVREEKPINPKLPTFFIVGDSTVKSGGNKGMFGWGEVIAPYFDPAKINVVNHAIGGRSSRTFFTEGRWAKVVEQMKAGDFVIIQFGHNDGGRIGDPANKNRASVRGLGDETVEDTKPDGTKEQVHSFGWYMSRYIADAKAKGVTVILCSPIPHKDKWENGRDFAEFAEWDAELAKRNDVFYFDLTLLVSDGYKKLGMEKVAGFFADPRTHTTAAGAQFNAACVIAGLKGLKNNPLGAYFSDKAKATELVSP
ncbi:MAG: rhamnogalacturonan acetylesterase [Nibricoccus sp.]